MKYAKYFINCVYKENTFVNSIIYFCKFSPIFNFSFHLQFLMVFALLNVGYDGEFFCMKSVKSFENAIQNIHILSIFYERLPHSVEKKIYTNVDHSQR